MRFFLDANVLLAAAITQKGRAQELLRFAEEGLCILQTSEYVLGEVRRNLAAKYPDRLAELEGLLEHLEIVPAPPTGLAEAAQTHLPEKDAPILAAAVASRCDYLVTGDVRHFGMLFGKVIAGVKVIKLVEALALVLSDAPE